MTELVFDMEFGRSTNGWNVGFAATESGIHRSCDDGTTWELVFEGSMATVVALSPSFSDDSTVVAGTSLGVALSTDEGTTWRIAELHTPSPVVASISLSPDFSQDGMVLAATFEDGAFVSCDHGRTWTRSSVGLYDSKLISVKMQNDCSVFIAAESGVFRSRNAGQSWEDLALPNRDASPTCLTCLGSIVLVGTEESGVFQSNDGGEIWIQVPEISTLSPILTLRMFEAENGSTEVICINGDQVNIYDVLCDQWSPRAHSPARNVTAAALVGSPPRLLLSLDNEPTRSMDIS
jgi:photosystem II stability/assembly factor-like uncharacterized protein